MTKRQFDCRLLYWGATLDESMLDAGVLQVDAPAGKEWNANGCTTLVEPFRNTGGQSWKPEAYAELADRMAYGISDREEES